MILVTGATGFLGKRICRKLDQKKLAYKKTSLSLGVDLRNYKQTLQLFENAKPEYVLNCAAYVGGIQFGYKHPAEMFHNNLLITINLLDACVKHNTKRLINPIANCAYPAKAKLFKEEGFWDGPLHESVMVYGFVRKASWMGAWAYQKQYGLDTINLIFPNMYGPGDHFEEERSHALGALIMKFVKAKENNEKFVTIWGSGKPVREWLHIDDGAEAMIRSIDAEPCLNPINIGVGSGISILAMGQLIKEFVGYTGDIRFDTSKPDGAPYKTMDGSKGKIHLGWQPNINFKNGLKDTIQWYYGS